jgi:hypothetical protein
VKRPQGVAEEDRRLQTCLENRYDVNLLYRTGGRWTLPIFHTLKEAIQCNVCGFLYCSYCRKGSVNIVTFKIYTSEMKTVHAWLLSNCSALNLLGGRLVHNCNLVTKWSHPRCDFQFASQRNHIRKFCTIGPAERSQLLGQTGVSMSVVDGMMREPRGEDAD